MNASRDMERDEAHATRLHLVLNVLDVAADRDPWLECEPLDRRTGIGPTISHRTSGTRARTKGHTSRKNQSKPSLNRTSSSNPW